MFAPIFTSLTLTLFSVGLIWYIFHLCFFTKFTGIPIEEEFDEFPLAEKLLKEGWVKSKPDPASHPKTGNEIVDKNQER